MFQTETWVVADGVKENQVPFFNKGCGQGIMVSEYVTQEGNLKLPSDKLQNLCPREPDGDAFRECTQIRDFSKDAYWDKEDVICQLKDLVIPLFERVYAGCQAVFLFNNATYHLAYADDAREADQKNFNQDGAQPTMRDGFNPSTGYSQTMQDSKGILKGRWQVLIERGLWPQGGLFALCKSCNPNPEGMSKKVDNPECGHPLTPRSCCARAVIASQPDFHAKKSQLQEVITEAGHLILFYPKFHCELNWIEYY